VGLEIRVKYVLQTSSTGVPSVYVMHSVRVVESLNCKFGKISGSDFALPLGLEADVACSWGCVFFDGCSSTSMGKEKSTPTRIV
jgi:hypothetical protein